MQTNKKIMAFIVSFMLICNAFFLLSCSENGSNDAIKKEEIPFNELSVDNSKNHINNSTLTNDFLIKDNKSSYEIVVSSGCSSIIEDASKELALFTMRATGVVLSSVEDTENPSRFISLGKTLQLDESGIEVDYLELGTDGYRIVSKDNNIFIIGNDYGVLYGVYGLLGDLFNYEYFYKDCYSLDKKDEVALKNYDIMEIPDIAYRAGGYGTMWQELQTINRYRMRSYPTFFVSIRGAIFHNAFSYLPYEENSELHPEWYNTGADQVCYTAHGNEEEYKEMVNETVRVLKEELIAQPDKNLVTFSLLDNGNSCVCDACKDSFNKYGSESAAVILFLNDVNKEIKDWFKNDGKEYSRDLKICFFAYNKYVKPPVSLNEDGEFVSNGVECDDGVCALIAPLEADYTVSFDSIENESTKNSLLGWNVVSKDIATWYYDTLYVSAGSHFVFYNSFNGYQNRYKYAYKIGSFWMFNEGRDQEYGDETAFNTLKMYLSSKLSWNVNEDYESLIDKFFVNMYGSACETMKKIFNEEKAHSIYNKTILNAGGDCYASLDKSTYWPKGVLLRWHDFLGEAINDIEYLKNTDMESYETIYSHIVAERIGIDYMLCSMHEGGLSNEILEELKLEFKADAEITESTDAAKVVKQWDL